MPYLCPPTLTADEQQLILPYTKLLANASAIPPPLFPVGVINIDPVENVTNMRVGIIVMLPQLTNHVIRDGNDDRPTVAAG